MRKGFFVLGFLLVAGCSSPYASSTKIYVQQDNLEKALENANRWIAEDSTNAQAFLWRGIIYTRKDNYIKAADDFKKAFTLDSTYMDKAKFEKTVSIASQPLMPYEAVSIVFSNAASQLIHDGKYDEALPYLEYSIKINPNNTNAYLLLHAIYNAKGDTKKAKEYLIEAVKRDPNNYHAKLQLAVLYSYEGNKDEAEKLLKELIKAVESDTTADDKVKFEIYKEFAVLMFELEKYDEAIKYFNKAYNIKKDDYEVLANLGKAYAAKSDYDNAVKYLKEAYALKKDDHRILQSLAEVLSNKKKYKEALKYINEAIALKKDDPNLYRLRAKIYKAMGRKRNAAKDLKKAKQLEKKGK
ncbi:MAG: tetratricopeptide repeat protein [Thermotogae bacterium]|nr:tetratricopeptide repeat protein [Thermotogota bacterium]